MKDHRRYLHGIPETGFKEYKTQEYIMKVLKKYNLNPKVICDTGVYVYIDFKKESTLAYRCDMDALEIEEQNEVDFKSTHIGRMHACGHDGHMAIMLGFAKYLSRLETANHNVLLIFQPAEEGPGGAKEIIKTDLFSKYNVKAIFGIHLFPEYNEHQIVTKAGNLMSNTCEVYVNIKGKSAHGAMPDGGIDALYVASQFITNTQSIVSRNVSPIDTGVVSFGVMNAGTRANIVCEDARLEGTIRAFNDATFELIKSRLNDLCIGLEKMYHVSVDIDFKTYYPAVYNDLELFNQFRNIVTKDFDFIELENGYMISEDFSYYQKEVPGIFIFLGTKTKEFFEPLHSNKFNFNEDVLETGLKLYISILNNIRE